MHPKRLATITIMLITLALLLVLTSGLQAASSLHSMTSSTHTAGLVVSKSGTVQTFCIDLGERQEVSGLDLLLASGMDVVMQGDPATGAIVCEIDNVGCHYPDVPCFCESERYWSYWQLVDGAWQYANQGVASSVVQAGEVEGWAWDATLPVL